MPPPAPSAAPPPAEKPVPEPKAPPDDGVAADAAAAAANGATPAEPAEDPRRPEPPPLRRRGLQDGRNRNEDARAILRAVNKLAKDRDAAQGPPDAAPTAPTPRRPPKAEPPATTYDE